jgi:hypothetical protein
MWRVIAFCRSSTGLRRLNVVERGGLIVSDMHVCIQSRLENNLILLNVTEKLQESRPAYAFFIPLICSLFCKQYGHICSNC